MEGIILAGGLGTRLRPRVQNLPKPMAAVAGRPFLCWLLDRLAQAGFRRIILSVGYRKSAIIEALGTRHGEIALDYAVEDVALGTGGAIRRSMSLIDRASDAIWVMNGDTISALRYEEMFAVHKAASPQMTMALARVDDASRYGSVLVYGDQVVGFMAGGARGPGIINLGTYLVSPRLFADAGWPEVFSFEREFLPLMAGRRQIRAFETQGWFVDIGVPEDFDRAQMELPDQLGRLFR
jgi:D-glycero-alpha-D-manno-heptose 1-phosphate guanylyltransferase